MSTELHIRESQIEDILVMYPEVAAHVLGENADITPVARQKKLPSGGRLDVVYIAGNHFLLVELKVENFKDEFLVQVLDYLKDLSDLQTKDKFPSGSIVPILLLPAISEAQRRNCKKEGVKVVVYSPAEVLELFQQRMRGLTKFLSLKPVDHGIWSLPLLNQPLLLLQQGMSIKRIANEIQITELTLKNRFRLAKDLLMVEGKSPRMALTELGEEFVKQVDPLAGFDSLSEGQAELMRNFIARFPFDSAAVFGIYSIVDAVWTLSRNTYPVGLELLSPFFRDSIGKNLDWKTDKAVWNGVRMYSNYAIDLGLLGRVGNSFYITPAGNNFILLLQLHKSVNLVDSVRSYK